MKTVISLGVLVTFFGLSATGLAADPTFAPKPGKTAEKEMKIDVTRSCKVIATLSCDMKDSYLGTLTEKKEDVVVKGVNSMTKAKCINAETGDFMGTGDDIKAVTAIIFESNGKYGYDQQTVTCKRAGAKKEKHVLTISVKKP